MASKLAVLCRFLWGREWHPGTVIFVLIFKKKHIDKRRHFAYTDYYTTTFMEKELNRTQDVVFLICKEIWERLMKEIAGF